VDRGQSFKFVGLKLGYLVFVKSAVVGYAVTLLCVCLLYVVRPLSNIVNKIGTVARAYSGKRWILHLKSEGCLPHVIQPTARRRRRTFRYDVSCWMMHRKCLRISVPLLVEHCFLRRLAVCLH